MILRQAAPASLFLMLAAPDPPPTQLVSLIVPMALGERIDAFEIETTGVEILAVCRMPAMWTLSAGANSAIIGTLAGQSGYGTTMLGPGDGLADLFLVRVERLPDEMPSSFAGTARLVTSGLQPRERAVRISTDEVRLTPAAHCPAPG